MRGRGRIGFEDVVAKYNLLLSINKNVKIRINIGGWVLNDRKRSRRTHANA